MFAFPTRIYYAARTRQQSESRSKRKLADHKVKEREGQAHRPKTLW